MIIHIEVKTRTFRRMAFRENSTSQRHKVRGSDGALYAHTAFINKQVTSAQRNKIKKVSNGDMGPSK